LRRVGVRFVQVAQHGDTVPPVELVRAFGALNQPQAAERAVVGERGVERKNATAERPERIDAAAGVVPEKKASAMLVAQHHHASALSQSDERFGFVVHLDRVTADEPHDIERALSGANDNRGEIAIGEWQ
jgi:hypothetical protein